MLKMDTDGSIVRTNNRNVESFETDLRDLIDLYSDEVFGDAENPPVVRWGVDAEVTDYGRYLFQVVNMNEFSKHSGLIDKCKIIYRNCDISTYRTQ